MYMRRRNLPSLNIQAYGIDSIFDVQTKLNNKSEEHTNREQKNGIQIIRYYPDRPFKM